ncbi:siroheme synthase CysG [Amorphus sp. 3PC139-8]|uniref:siroheme synthase CysG n=1 Tax=Amorphus sp. 3PC139-8 TaxID=2735676 RepID=UPI00345C8898
MPVRFKQPSERKPGRIAPLAKLPVFFDLAGRTAVVIGGSEGAAWKAELLAAAGAEVSVFAAQAGEDMEELTAAALPAGALRLVRRGWRPDDLAGAAIVVGDADTVEEAQAIREAGRTAGAAVNIVDKPDFCDFQFGSIVNRSPVVIGISTDGAAPVLGQAIRRRIEALVPPYLGGWARAAKDCRAFVADRIADPAGRRRFWERFCDLAFRAPPDDDAAGTLQSLATDIGAGSQGGRVTLVGAGPGDAEYLTLKAMRALQSADVILFDDLISDEVMELARREARRLLVGKRGARASCRQEEINALMIKLAGQGKHVVRLKSGDPMIFGRAGEEIAELSRHDIAVEVVPGITSALALASKLGVSLTHRDCAHSVRFVTGHARDGQLPEIDWTGLADPETTLVVYMGGRTCSQFAEQLIAKGLPPSTPSVAGWALGRPDERIVRGTLASVADDVAEVGYERPVLLGIGEVFLSALSAATTEVPDLPMEVMAS